MITGGYVLFSQIKGGSFRSLGLAVAAATLSTIIAAPAAVAADRANKQKTPGLYRMAGTTAIKNFNVGSFSGTTVGGPTFARAYSDCTGPSTTATATAYSVQAFTVPYDGVYGVTSAQTNGWDGYIHVYQGSFSAAAPLTNCIAGNDDGYGGVGTSDIAGVALTAGTTYYLVTSGYDNAESGAFVNSVFATFSLPVPAQSGAALGMTSLAVLLAGAGFAARRRKQV